MKAQPPSRLPQPRNVAAPRSARKFPWTKAEDALLGRLTDREVAKKCNRTLSGVRDRRKFLGKPAVGHAPKPIRIEREPRDHYAWLFATKSDREIRAMLGWSYKRIRTRRRQLGGGKVRKLQPEWTLEEDRLLGTKPDEVLAREFGRPVGAVRHRRGKKRIRLLLKPWRPEDDRILGTRTDREVALLLGRSVTNVGWRRKKLGIPAKVRPHPWTVEEEALLGSKPDEALARAFGRTAVAVEARRIQLGRPKPDAVFKVIKSRAPALRGQPASAVNAKPGAAYCTWAAEEDTLLGKFTDKEVARRLGYAVKRVRRRRYLLGIPSNNPNCRHWTQEEIALLGTRPDREVAPLVRRSLSNVRGKRIELGIPFRNPRYGVWKPDELALLGKLPDNEVARSTGHSLTSVRQARTNRQILSVRRAAPEWRPDEEALLGTAPDREIAARLNRTVPAVRLRRVLKHIPVYTPRTD